MRTEFWFVNLKERDNLQDLDVDGRITLKWVSNKDYRIAWAKLIWLL
jgi:hypothetical protein